jgi:hypothetical protein
MRFPFTDLHSFKDYVEFVKNAAPDRFPKCDWAGPDDQWTLELAFEGLRHGLKQAVEEKGKLPVFEKSEKLVEEAYHHYREGRKKEGYFKLDEIAKLLRKVPSQ